jgi:hypothetical protein
MDEKDSKMKELPDVDLIPEQLETRYERYIMRLGDDMRIACGIFAPSDIADAHIALGIDLLMSIGGPQYAREVLDKMSAALEVDPEASVN